MKILCLVAVLAVATPQIINARFTKYEGFNYSTMESTTAYIDCSKVDAYIHSTDMNGEKCTSLFINGSYDTISVKGWVHIDN